MRIYSACLLGIKCRYDGTHRFMKEVYEDFLRHFSNHEEEILIVCPEVLAGLPSPRDPIYFSGGDGRDFLDGRSRIVIAEGREKGKDLSRIFLDLAQRLDVVIPSEGGIAFLRDKSPSCGVNKVYIDGELKSGMGFFAAILKKKGFALKGV